MKKFIERNILFPKRLGFMPYFWVFSLFLMAGQLLSSKQIFDWLDVFLVIIFLKFYHDGYWVHRFNWLDILVQLSIAVYFSIKFPSGGGVFFVYTAWEIGSLPFKQKKFLYYYFAYLIVGITCLSSFFLFTSKSIMDFNFGFGVVISLTFTIGSPLAARSLANSYRRRFKTSQNNKRLESIIRQNERDRISQDLHDNIGQSFSIITLKSELASKLIDKNPQKAQQQLIDIAKTSREDLNLVRQIVANLNEKTIASVMIEEDNNLEVAGIRQISINEDSSGNWPKNIQHVISAVIKETTTNVIRYSKADVMKLVFEEDTDNYLLDISDDGIGFKDPSDHKSYGLSGINNRLIEINGHVEISSHNGVIIKITVPKKG